RLMKKRRYVRRSGPSVVAGSVRSIGVVTSMVLLAAVGWLWIESYRKPPLLLRRPLSSERNRLDGNGFDLQWSVGANRGTVVWNYNLETSHTNWVGELGDPSFSFELIRATTFDVGPGTGPAEVD